MCGKWKDGSPIMYGGNGHPSSAGYGPACRFMFPGESDTLDWGTGCVPPNGPKNWTEETALNNPGDRRGVGVTGPVTFHPGDAQELDIAFSWARDYVNPDQHASLAKLRQVTDEINAIFAANRLPNGELFYGINDNRTSKAIPMRLYPNPASDRVTLDFNTLSSNNARTIEILSSQGALIGKVTLGGTQKLLKIDLAGIPAGVYVIWVATGDEVIVKKLVVIH
jgi:hypothetical protein